MENMWKEIIWRQFGASIDALENAIKACPVELWGDRTKYHQYWYVTYHTLFWLDYYLSDLHKDYTPPPPYTLSEFDPSGLMPERIYTRDEMLAYLEHGRRKCKTAIAAMTEEWANRKYQFGKAELSFAELLLYNMRHVQHHTAQLNLLLRQNINSAPGWVFAANDKLVDD